MKKMTRSLDNLRMQLKTSSSLMVASPRMEFPSRVHSQSSTSATLRIWLLLINLTMGASSSYFLQLSTFSRILTESVSTPLRRLSQSLSNGRTISMRRLKAKLTISPVLMMRMSSHLLMKMKNKRMKRKTKKKKMKKMISMKPLTVLLATTISSTSHRLCKRLTSKSPSIISVNSRTSASFLTSI